MQDLIRIVKNFFDLVVDFITNLVEGLATLIKSLASVSQSVASIGELFPTFLATIVIPCVALIIVLRIVGR